MKTLLTVLLCFAMISLATAQPDRDVPSKARDQQILDDLIVDGSLCVGLDCVNGENFGFKTLILKENNVRLKFDDTSVSSSFPRNDWCLEANASNNGGSNHFAIMDQGPSGGTSGGNPVFKIIAGAPSNSIYVDAQGDVGFGNNNPVVEMHSTDGDTPTLRLEQNGSSGWTPQTWDIAANETNFFIRDVSHGSKLPFRIRPDAPSNSLHVAADGKVGLGTASPNASLHVTGDELAIGSAAGTTAVKVEIGKDRAMDGNAFFDLIGDASAFSDFGARFIRFSTGNTQLTHRGTGTFSIRTQDAGALSFQTNNADRVRILSTGEVGINTNAPTTGGNFLSVNGGADKPGGGDWGMFSDKKLKKNIQPFTDGLKAVLQLKPVTYQYNGKGNIKDTDKMYVGVVAQELQEVAPYMVKNVSVTEMTEKVVDGQRELEEVKQENYLHVDATAIRYMLVNAVKEQQLEIEDLKDQIEELRELVAQISTNSQAATLLNIGYLEQNQPNPFNAVTTIRYQLPKGTQQASIRINDASGKLIKDVVLGSADTAYKGQLTLEAFELPAGTYSYTLVVDGRMSDTKQMVLTK
ncbi:MAG: tail fiber domain-containing protein [Saprospiraceae bacterium]|nr:tail fiber domain-containing protein [Saprospiraceae bacterium]